MGQSEEKSSAEIIRIGGEYVIVEQCVDAIEHDRHNRRRPTRAKKYRKEWVADWPGCDGIKGFGVSGDSKEEVVWLMEEKIERKKKLKQLEEWWEKRRAQRIVREFVEKNAPKKDGGKE